MHRIRFALWHVKDMDKAKPERSTEVNLKVLILNRSLNIKKYKAKAHFHGA